MIKHTLTFLSVLLIGFNSFGQTPASFEGPFKDVKMCETTEVKSQDRTGTCWSFSTTSFIESELLRLGRGHWDLSEMFTVRMIYMDKAEQYLRFQGTNNFSQGSLGHDVFRVYNKYGMMPESAYAGKSEDQIHNHGQMEKDMKSYLDSLIKSGSIDPNWRDAITGIMDQVMGEIPNTFEVNGKEYTPRTFADEVLKLNSDDYIGFTSFIHQPKGEMVVVQVPDNYSRGEYYNVDLSTLMSVMETTIEGGYTIEWDGDVSEHGFAPKEGVALYIDKGQKVKSVNSLPEEKEYNENIRQSEFDDYTTTDDHLMHIVGITKDEDGNEYFITKNSWGTKLSFDGFLLMSEAYVAMKTVCIIVPKDALSAEMRAEIEGNSVD